MDTHKIFESFSIFVSLSVLCIFPNLSFGQAQHPLRPDEAYPHKVPETLTTSSEEETMTPLPPVSGNQKGIPQPPIYGKDAQNKQNKENGLLGQSEYAAQPASGCCPQDSYPPGPLKVFIRQMINDWRDNNLWPEPFPEPDREQVRSTLDMMIQSGWRHQNLLSDFHFDPETGQLNASGQEKLRWILWEVPEKHRIVYVSRAMNPSETAARLGSVQKIASQLMGDRALPPILESELSPVGWPSSQVDTIQRKFQDTTPPPRLKSSSQQNNSSPNQ